MSTVSSNSGKLKMVVCGRCNGRVFVRGDLAPLHSIPCTKCGHPIIVPVMLRQFELRSIIGTGGMGTVYRAFDTTLEREVAVKMMKKDLVQDEQSTRAFFREARALAALNHTNIIHVYTFEKYDNQLYLVMELADRPSMDYRIEHESHLPELHVLDIGVKIASALDLALKHGFLHRDIKPGNILFNVDGEPKLVDFGLAGSAADGLGDEHSIMGTPYYVAPEKIKREAETFLSDMYSLAATMYQGLTGHVPFEAPTVDEVVLAHVNTPLVPPNQVLFEVTKATSDGIVRAMSKDPAERFQSYDEFIMEFTAARSKLLIQRYRGSDEAPPEQ